MMPIRPYRVLLVFVFVLVNLVCTTPKDSVIEPHVRVGAEQLLEDYAHELLTRNVGLIMNPTARVNGVHVLDTLLQLGVPVNALFAAEHGFRGDQGAGEVIIDGVDQSTGLPVYSLYGSTKKPSPEMLEGIDLLIFDMQDVGARFYTYNATMKYVIEAAADADIELWILDRPNPLGGDYVAGWILEEEYESFVGMYPIPVAHGLTLGELALMAIGEGWLDTDHHPKLKVIPIEGWQRSMKWNETGLEWIPPSPNLPTFAHAYAYIGTCFIEGTTLSEGRGTSDPFLTLGGISTDFGIDTTGILSDWNSSGLNLDIVTFTPESIPGKAIKPKGLGELHTGIHITNPLELEDPLSVGLRLMQWLMEHSEQARYNDYLYLLAGTDDIDHLKEQDFSPAIQNVSIDWGLPLNQFVEKRKSYLLY